MVVEQTNVAVCAIWLFYQLFSDLPPPPFLFLNELSCQILSRFSEAKLCIELEKQKS